MNLFRPALRGDSPDLGEPTSRDGMQSEVVWEEKEPSALIREGAADFFFLDGEDDGAFDMWQDKAGCPFDTWQRPEFIKKTIFFGSPLLSFIKK